MIISFFDANHDCFVFVCNISVACYENTQPMSVDVVDFISVMGVEHSINKDDCMMYRIVQGGTKVFGDFKL